MIKIYSPKRFYSYEEIGTRIYVYEASNHSPVGYLQRINGDTFKMFKDGQPVIAAQAVTFDEAMAVYEQLQD